MLFAKLLSDLLPKIVTVSAGSYVDDTWLKGRVDDVHGLVKSAFGADLGEVRGLVQIGNQVLGLNRVLSDLLGEDSG